MTPDEQNEIYQKGFEAGKNHSSPSSITNDFMKEQKDINKEILTKMNEIYVMNAAQTEIIKNIHAQTLKTNGRVTKHDDDIDELKRESDKNSWIPKVVGGMVGLVLVAFAGGIIALIYK